MLTKEDIYSKEPKARDAWATLLFTSKVILPELAKSNPRYGNLSTMLLFPPSSSIGPQSLSSHNLPVTICLVLGMLTVRPKALWVCLYSYAEFSAPDLDDARRAASSSNWHSVSFLSHAVLQYLLNIFVSYLYLMVIPTPSASFRPPNRCTN